MVSPWEDTTYVLKVDMNSKITFQSVAKQVLWDRQLINYQYNYIGIQMLKGLVQMEARCVTITFKAVKNI